MNRYEHELLGAITQKVYFNLIHGGDNQNLIENLIEEIEEVIYNLPLTSSAELLNNLYRLIELIEIGNEIINEILINEF